MPKPNESKRRRRLRKKIAAARRDMIRYGALGRLGSKSAREAASEAQRRLRQLTEMLVDQEGSQVELLHPNLLRSPVAERHAIQVFLRLADQLERDGDPHTEALMDDAFEALPPHLRHRYDDRVHRALFLAQPPHQRMQVLREHRRRHMAGRRVKWGPTRGRNRYTRPCTCWGCRNAHLFAPDGSLKEAS